MLTAPSPAHGTVAPGFEPVARVFADHLRRGLEVGAGLTIYHRGACVVDVWGGLADRDRGTPWQRDTRVVLFSVTKAMTAIAFHGLADRGLLQWDAPVARYWPGFARNGKADITVEGLLSHRAGLAALDVPLTLDDCLRPEQAPLVLEALEVQRPLWPPGTDQAYHAVTYGMYAGELFRRISGEPIGDWLAREWFGPVDSDVRLGTPSTEDHRCATLYPPSNGMRLRNMALAAIRAPQSSEGRIARVILDPTSMPRRAFGNPNPGRGGAQTYNTLPVRRAQLPWASATGSAHGVARALLPFSQGGTLNGQRMLAPETIAPLHQRVGWSECDRVLNKPIGWNRGFLKEERGLFGPATEAFGHSGIGGALAWCDPVSELSFGYVLNALDWRVRSPRTIALLDALYASPGLLG
jgi:CubicO group peptidase (beta-lactamase class C family)